MVRAEGSDKSVPGLVTSTRFAPPTLTEAASKPGQYNSLSDQMLQIRTLETRLQAMCDSGELAVDLHFVKGQEGCSVGVCSALQPQDMVLCHHRMIGWALARGVPLDMLVKELLGGAMGEMHFRAPEYGFAHSFQLVGTVVPVAAGVAWALKQKGEGGIAVAVFGEAATANGQFHEGLNIAAVQGLPLLLVCENNHRAGNVMEEQYLPVPWVVDRARGYGIESFNVDGNDLDAVIDAAAFATKYVRYDSRPFLLELDTTRLGKHKQGMGDLRSKDEMAALRLRDPLRHVSVDPVREQELKDQVDAAIEAARS